MRRLVELPCLISFLAQGGLAGSRALEHRGAIPTRSLPHGQRPHLRPLAGQRGLPSVPARGEPVDSAITSARDGVDLSGLEMQQTYSDVFLPTAILSPKLNSAHEP